MLSTNFGKWGLARVYTPVFICTMACASNSVICVRIASSVMPFCRKIAGDPGDNRLLAAFRKGACDGLPGVGDGGVTREAELLGHPQPEQAVAPGLCLEFQLLVEGKFLLEAFLAFVEGGHRESSSADGCFGVVAAGWPHT